jgi:hypothetical protein
LKAFLALFNLNLDLRAWLNRLVPGSLQDSDMEEGVPRLIGEFYEAKALLGIKPFNDRINSGATWGGRLMGCKRRRSA